MNINETLKLPQQARDIMDHWGLHWDPMFIEYIDDDKDKGTDYQRACFVLQTEDYPDYQIPGYEVLIYLPYKEKILMGADFLDFIGHMGTMAGLPQLSKDMEIFIYFLRTLHRVNDDSWYDVHGEY